MKTTHVVLIAAAAVAQSIAFSGVAQAEAGSFESPSGSIQCLMGTFGPGPNFAYCAIPDSVQKNWEAPPRPADCHLNWGRLFILKQGVGADFACYDQNLPAPTKALDYGQTQSVGAITCDSEASGMTCTDSTTGHFFSVSRDSYNLG